ncbi:MAG: O-antigen ligase family protein, partial [Acidobacteriota bacterium]
AWNARIAAWRDTLELWRSAPWTGIGVGAFRDAFARVQSPSLPGSWYHAHSDLLETLATAGIVVSTLLVAGVAFVLRGLWRAFTDGRRSEDRATALAAAGATVFALLHAAVEFPLTIPANATALAVVVGLGLTAPRSSERREQRPRVRRTHFLDHDIDSTPRAASGADATRGVRRLDRSHDDLSRGTSRRSRLESTSPRNDAARD